MASIYGEKLKVSIFGQSHSSAIGVVVDGIPAGVRIDADELNAFLARRAPGGGARGGPAQSGSRGGSAQSGASDGGGEAVTNGEATARGGARAGLTTARTESDEPEFLSGLTESTEGYTTCGAPLAAVIRNKDARSGDYDELRSVPRPAHADYTARVKYGGFEDFRGGGHFSGRLTAPLCVAGGVCLQALRAIGVSIGAHLSSVGGGACDGDGVSGGVCYGVGDGVCGGDAPRDEPFDPVGVSASTFAGVLKNAQDLFPVIRRESGEAMIKAILEAGASGDSIGGVVECAAVGVPAGWGDPMFDGIENRVARAVFGIPGVKGIEFGSGFAGSALRGSQNNDAFYYDGDGQVRTKTNNSGGILGGITNGMPIIFRAAFKPTPSISSRQDSVNLTRRERSSLRVKGRHDPCIAVRAVPCVEAAFAIALYDACLCARADGC